MIEGLEEKMGEPVITQVLVPPLLYYCYSSTGVAPVILLYVMFTIVFTGENIVYSHCILLTG